MVDVKLDEQAIERLRQLASDPLLFSETMLVNPEDGRPFKANYTQRQIFEAFKHNDRVVVRVHRRAGKTYALSVLSIWKAVTQPYSRILIVCPDLSKVDQIFSNIDAFLDANPALNASITARRRAPFMLRGFSNGSTIKGFSAASRSKGEAQSLRGQGADLVIIDEAAYLNEEDYLAINPIILGDLHHAPPKAIMASTPRFNSGRFFDICMGREASEHWYQIHIPITENPDYEGRLDLIRSSCSQYEWEVEYLADFPHSGDGVFRKDDILNARLDYRYSLDDVPTDGMLAIGVDWDKVQAGCTISVVHYQPESRVYRVIWREEVDRGEFTLTEAVDRIIQLNERLKPVAIYVDRGYGEQQVELLHLYGKRAPHTGLHEKVKGWWFHQHVERIDPVTGEKVKVRLKDAMIAFLTNLLEQDRFKYSMYDLTLELQLRSYRVVSVSNAGPRYSSEGEHAIDSIGLAIWALKDFEDREIGLIRDVTGFRAMFMESGADKSVLAGFYRRLTPITVAGESRISRSLSENRSWARDF